MNEEPISENDEQSKENNEEIKDNKRRIIINEKPTNQIVEITLQELNERFNKKNK